MINDILGLEPTLGWVTMAGSLMGIFPGILDGVRMFLVGSIAIMFLKMENQRILPTKDLCGECR